MRTHLLPSVGAALAFLVAAVLVLIVVPLIQIEPSASIAISSLGWNVLGGLVVGAVLLLAARGVILPPALPIAAAAITAVWGILLLGAVSAFGGQDQGMQWAAILTYLCALGDFVVAISAALTGVVSVRSASAT